MQKKTIQINLKYQEEFIMQEKKFNIVGIIGGAVYALANFFPESIYYDGSSYIPIHDSIVQLIFGIVTIIFALKNIKSGLINGVFLLSLGAFEIFLAYLEYDHWHNGSNVYYSPGFGQFLFAVGSIVTFAGGIYALVQRKKNS